jgi:hypothetical protein
METRITRRRVTATADAPGGLASTGSCHGHSGADRIAIRRFAFQVEGEEMAFSRSLIVEIDQWRVLRDKQEVGASIVVEVGTGEPSAMPNDLATKISKTELRDLIEFLASLTSPTNVP